MHILKSIAAVLIGFIVVVVLSTGTDALMQYFGIFPSTELVLDTSFLMLALFYRTVFTVIGGYIVARIAPSAPMTHALVLGVIGLVVGTLGAVSAGTSSGSWYPWALVVLSIPSVWLGARIYTRKA